MLSGKITKQLPNPIHYYQVRWLPSLSLCLFLIILFLFCLPYLSPRRNLPFLRGALGTIGGEEKCWFEPEAPSVSRTIISLVLQDRNKISTALAPQQDAIFSK